jgi:hypothetical protein
MRDLQEPFVRFAALEPGFRQPPGELSRAAKRCLTPKGDEKCLAIIRFISAPSIHPSQKDTGTMSNPTLFEILRR